MSRTYTIDGKQMEFNFREFKRVFNEYRKRNNLSVEDLREKLSKKKLGGLGISTETVRNWQRGSNAPIDIDTVKDLAERLGIDYMLLLTEQDGGKKMYKLTERQKDASKRIFDVLTWFLVEFNNSDGFSRWWAEFEEQGVEDLEQAFNKRLTRMQERVGLVIEQEFFDLQHHEIYDDFCELASEELVNVYADKVDRDCRHEMDYKAFWKDYETARNHLDEIVGRIV